MEYFPKNLGEREYRELTLKGYLKLKFDIPIKNLMQFDLAYRTGKEITFDYNGEVLKTVITSIEVGEENHESKCKVFLGFARQ
jgi:hypothetical protein